MTNQNPNKQMLIEFINQSWIPQGQPFQISKLHKDYVLFLQNNIQKYKMLQKICLNHFGRELIKTEVVIDNGYDYVPGITKSIPTYMIVKKELRAGIEEIPLIKHVPAKEHKKQLKVVADKEGIQGLVKLREQEQKAEDIQKQSRIQAMEVVQKLEQKPSRTWEVIQKEEQEQKAFQAQIQKEIDDMKAEAALEDSEDSEMLEIRRRSEETQKRLLELQRKFQEKKERAEKAAKLPICKSEILGPEVGQEIPEVAELSQSSIPEPPNAEWLELEKQREQLREQEREKEFQDSIKRAQDLADLQAENRKKQIIQEQQQARKEQAHQLKKEVKKDLKPQQYETWKREYEHCQTHPESTIFREQVRRYGDVDKLEFQGIVCESVLPGTFSINPPELAALQYRNQLKKYEAEKLENEKKYFYNHYFQRIQKIELLERFTRQHRIHVAKKSIEEYNPPEDILAAAETEAKAIICSQFQIRNGAIYNGKLFVASLDFEFFDDVACQELVFNFPQAVRDSQMLEVNEELRKRKMQKDMEE